MKQQKLNYEAKVVCCNGAISAFDFHGDNAPLAIDHIQHVANAGIDGLNFDYTPDKIHHISYKSKANVKWNCVFPQPKDESKEVKEGGELFTGGEWWQEINHNDYIDINGDDGFRICSICVRENELEEVERTVEEATANADLIIQAPAMFKLLKEIENTLPYEEEDIWEDSAQARQISELFERLKEVLRKATPKK